MDNEKVRSIRLPAEVWDLLDADAARCRRSAQKQLEAILVNFYTDESVEINRQRLEFVSELLPHSKTKIPMLKAAAETPKKKKTA